MRSHTTCYNSQIESFGDLLEILRKEDLDLTQLDCDQIVNSFLLSSERFNTLEQQLDLTQKNPDRPLAIAEHVFNIPIHSWDRQSALAVLDLLFSESHSGAFELENRDWQDILSGNNVRVFRHYINKLREYLNDLAGSFNAIEIKQSPFHFFNHDPHANDFEEKMRNNISKRI